MPYLEAVRKLLIILFLFPLLAQAQIGGRSVYSFLKLTPQARIAGLGGINLTTVDHDQNFAWYNPAVVNDSMHNRLSLSYVNYFSGINYGYASYARTFEGIADFHAGLQYVGYGKMIEADEFGNQTGTFSASDVALVIGASRKFYRFRVGANVKFINSNIGGYNSFSAMAFDIGGLYLSEDNLLQVAIVFQNIGFQMQKYSKTGIREPLPFEALVGVSYRLKYLPLRFSVTTTNLQQPNMIYQDPDPEPQFDLSGEPIEPKKRIADNIFRHFVFGTEFIIGKRIMIRLGYNHLRRSELRSENKAGLSGFSGGLGLKMLKINLDYSYAHFHAIGGTHSLSISTDLDQFLKKGKKVAKPVQVNP